jgi:hypothetical protein
LQVCLDWALGRGWAFVEDDTMDQRALPAPDQPDRPDRPRGRHEASRRSVGGPTGMAIAIVIAAVVFAGVLATWLIGSAKEAPDKPAAGAASTEGGPTSRPPGQGSFGNLVVNWSFEQDLSGWQALGAADASREPQGRTSGSCASVRAREQGRVGLALPGAVPQAKPGQRYVASAWVRSTAPGLPVTVRLSGTGAAAKESSKTTATTLPGLEWRRVIVAHTVASPGPLRLEIVADGVPSGDALLADEVVVRQG